MEGVSSTLSWSFSPTQVLLPGIPPSALLISQVPLPPPSKAEKKDSKESPKSSEYKGSSAASLPTSQDSDASKDSTSAPKDGKSIAQLAASFTIKPVIPPSINSSGSMAAGVTKTTILQKGSIHGQAISAGRLGFMSEQKSMPRGIHEPSPLMGLLSATADAAPHSLDPETQAILQKAINGDPQSQMTIARCRMKGTNGIPKDENDALWWVEQAARQNDVAAQLQMGMEIWSSQMGYNPPSISYEWLVQAAENGSVQAQFELGKISLMGNKWIQKNETYAAQWFYAAARNGHPEAQYILSSRVFRKQTAIISFTQALELLSASAQAGYPKAQFYYAQFLESGALRVPKDVGVAMKLYYASAKQGLLDGQYTISMRVLAGTCTLINTAEAIHLLTNAAEKGYAKAQCELGNFCEYGKHGVPKNIKKAHQLYLASAKQGYGEAEYQIGYAVMCSDSEIISEEEAMDFLKKAAKKGIGKARLCF